MAIGDKELDLNYLSTKHISQLTLEHVEVRAPTLCTVQSLSITFDSPINQLPFGIHGVLVPGPRGHQTHQTLKSPV